MTDRPILLIGASGQVGGELARTLAPFGKLSAPSRDQLDLGSPDSIRAALRAVTPALIVNAAAYTAVDRAESDPQTCELVNAIGPGILAAEARRLNAPLIHFSTDYVFDGTRARPYLEDDEPSPLNTYGRTKLEGERAIAAAGGAYITLRTSWVYGLTGRNFLVTMRALARSRTELRVVNDQVGCPTWSRGLARAVAHVLADSQSRHHSQADYFAERTGIYHLCASGTASWYDFARSILVLDPSRHLHTCRALIPISSAEYATAARRPAYSVLATDKFRRQWGYVPNSWPDELATAMSEAE